MLRAQPERRGGLGSGKTLEDQQHHAGQPIKRQQISSPKGQHCARVQSVRTGAVPDAGFVDEAKRHLAKTHTWVRNTAWGRCLPGSLMAGLHENTACFGIGDTSRPEDTPHKVVIRGGGLDHEDPGAARCQYPADHAFRLVDVVVRKPVAD